jgi:hypothetical protein
MTAALVKDDLTKETDRFIAAKAEHDAAAASLAETRVDLANRRVSCERAEDAVKVRETAVARREAQAEVATRKAQESLATADKERAAVAAKVHEYEERARHLAGREERLARVKGEIETLLKKLVEIR